MEKDAHPPPHGDTSTPPPAFLSEKEKDLDSSLKTPSRSTSLEASRIDPTSLPSDALHPVQSAHSAQLSLSSVVPVDIRVRAIGVSVDTHPRNFHSADGFTNLFRAKPPADPSLESSQEQATIAATTSSVPPKLSQTRETGGDALPSGNGRLHLTLAQRNGSVGSIFSWDLPSKEEIAPRRGTVGSHTIMDDRDEPELSFGQLSKLIECVSHAGNIEDLTIKPLRQHSFLVTGFSRLTSSRPSQSGKTVRSTTNARLVPLGAREGGSASVFPSQRRETSSCIVDCGFGDCSSEDELGRSDTRKYSQWSALSRSDVDGFGDGYLNTGSDGDAYSSEDNVGPLISVQEGGQVLGVDLQQVSGEDSGRSTHALEHNAAEGKVGDVPPSRKTALLGFYRYLRLWLYLAQRVKPDSIPSDLPPPYSPPKPLIRVPDDTKVDLWNARTTVSTGPLHKGHHSDSQLQAVHRVASESVLDISAPGHTNFRDNTFNIYAAAPQLWPGLHPTPSIMTHWQQPEAPPRLFPPPLPPPRPLAYKPSCICCGGGRRA
ncbi:hypothetical protein V500_02253 [Pseudogymnoascus sp. VKM F-4518 (FW-2643)]|nr:hypothetical protein V500_02253 [Pseudogymnoascus sp. VKM F-4518 (FW-2643)]